MQKIRFCCLAIVAVFLAANMAYAQQGDVLKPVGQNPAQKIEKIPQKPVKLKPSTTLESPVNSDIANIGIMFIKLTVDPGLINGNRYAYLEMRNASSKPVEYAQYFLKYWWRAGTSDDWQFKNQASFQYPMGPHQTRTGQIPVGALSGAKEFRVTLHNDQHSPVILEITTTVNSN